MLMLTKIFFHCFDIFFNFFKLRLFLLHILYSLLKNEMIIIGHASGV